jgi:hypothetical protein
LRPIGDMSLRRESSSATRADLLSHRFRLRAALAIVYRHRRAVFRQPQRDRTTEPSGRACHESCLSA